MVSNRNIQNLVIDELKIAVIAGAGISAASGVPTFRGEDGLWKKYDPMELATPQAFRRDPELVWEWYMWRIEKVQSCKPNEAHHALVELEEEGFLEGIITQNVDGLHICAGNSKDKVVTIHGDLFGARCTNNDCSGRIWWTKERISTLNETIPRCTNCNSYLRPDVVWFGESLDQTKLNKAQNILKNSSILLIIGTSGYVQPVASLPQYFKTYNPNGYIFEFNIEETPLSSLSDRTFLGSAAKTVPVFLKQLISRYD